MTGSDEDDDAGTDATAETGATIGTAAVTAAAAVMGLYGAGAAAAAAAAETVATEEAIADDGRPNGTGGGCNDRPKSSAGPSSKYENADDEAAMAVAAAVAVTAAAADAPVEALTAVTLETGEACAASIGADA